MKPVEHTSERMILEDRSFGARHWGIFVMVLSGGGFIALQQAGSDVPVPAYIMLAGFFIAGSFAAVFMKRKPRNVLDKKRDRGVVEYPVRFATRIDTEEFRLSEVESIVAAPPSLMEAALARTSNLGSSTSSSMLGFAYRLKDGKSVFGGEYTNAIKQMKEVIEQIGKYLSVPIEEGE